MTLSPELLAMIADVKPASDEDLDQWRIALSFQRGMTVEVQIASINSLIARIVEERKTTMKQWLADGEEHKVAERKFKIGDRVHKPKGGQWHGRVVGFYSTELTPIGYAVESSREYGSVQIYPEAALSALEERG